MIRSLFIIISVLIITDSCILFKTTKKAIVQSDIILAKQYLKYINKQDLENNLSVLASDEFEGRETTKEGQ